MAFDEKGETREIEEVGLVGTYWNDEEGEEAGQEVMCIRRWTFCVGEPDSQMVIGRVG